MEWIIYPLKGLPVIWSLTVVSLVAGVVLLLMYGACSNQTKLRLVKRRIHAAFLEALLFRHDVFVSLRAQWRMFVGGLHYVALAVPPILIICIPCILLLSQLNLYYGYRPINAGEELVLRAKVQDRSLLDQVSIELSPGLKSTAPIRLYDSQEILWRVEPVSSGSQTLNAKLAGGGNSLSAPIAVESGFLRLDAVNTAGAWKQLLYPGRLLGNTATAISEFAISYPSRYYNFVGYECSWITIFLIVSLLSGLVASRVLRVEI